MDPASNLIRDGVTISFRMRQLALEDVDPFDVRPDGGEGSSGDTDPGYTMQGNGKGPIGIVSRAGGTQSLGFTIRGGRLLGAGSNDNEAVNIPLCDPLGWVEVWATAAEHAQ